MSQDIYNKAIELVEKYKKAPRMYATDREAWMSMMFTILDVVDVRGIRVIQQKHYPIYGNTYLNLDKPLEDDWARTVADDVIILLRRCKLKAFS